MGFPWLLNYELLKLSLYVVIKESIINSDMFKHTNLHQRSIGIHIYYDKTEHKGNRCQRKSIWHCSTNLIDSKRIYSVTKVTQWKWHGSFRKVNFHDKRSHCTTIVSMLRLMYQFSLRCHLGTWNIQTLQCKSSDVSTFI